MNDCLGIADRSKLMPMLAQCGYEFDIVVNLAIENDLNGAVLVANRLIASGQINDTQPAHPHDERRNAFASGTIITFTIWAAMRYRCCHRAHPIEPNSFCTRQINRPTDTTHALVSSIPLIISRTIGQSNHKILL